MRKLTVFASFVTLILSQAAMTTTYYVRIDGDTGTQCKGQADAAYPGSGTVQPCAVNHPFWVFPPSGARTLQSGDTLIISPGEYMIGIGAPTTSDWNPHCRIRIDRMIA